MTNKKVCFSTDFDKTSNFGSGKDLLQSKDFYLLMEQFCNIEIERDAEIAWFLNYYFNDEGYVDCWRIPHLMLDICEGTFLSHQKTIDCPQFIRVFTRFTENFAKYCADTYYPFLQDQWIQCNEQDQRSAMLQKSINDHIITLATETYHKILSNISGYQSKGA